MRFKQTGRTALMVSALLCTLAACGDDSPTSPDNGGGGSAPLSFDTFQAADVVIGQTDMSSGAANAGGSTNSVGLSAPYGTSGNGSLYITDQANHRVLGFSSIPSANGIAADFVIGQDDFLSRQSGTSANKLNTPRGCTVAGGKLFVGDLINSRVLIWNTLPTSNVPADVVVGQRDFTSSSSGTSQSTLSFPAGVFVDGGRLFVADGSNRVLIWNAIPTVNGAPADVVVGQTDFTSGGAGLSDTTFSLPIGLWVGQDKLVVCDGTNNRVLIWNTIPAVNGAPADIVVGAPDFTTAGSGVPSATSIGQPKGVTSDGTNLYVADSKFHRVLIYPFPTANGAAATGVLGQSDFTLSAGNDPNQDGLSEGVVSAKTFGIGLLSQHTPNGVTIIGRQLIVSDRSNNRYLIFNSK